MSLAQGDVCFDRTNELEIFVGEVSAQVVEDSIEGIDESAGGGDRGVHRGFAGDLFDEVWLMDLDEVLFGDGFSVDERAKECECFVAVLGGFLNHSLLGGVDHVGLLCLYQIIAYAKSVSCYCRML